MDKNAIKKFAVWARRELIARVSQRAAYFDITENSTGDIHADSVLGRVMSSDEKTQRQALIAKIQEKGYQQVMEEVAYTWFNRFIALRFMEANGYLPSRIRLFTNLENRFKPQILDEAVNLEFDWLEPKRVYDYKTANDDDGLFKYLIIAQCNAFSKLLPGMFQKISDYTELLFPDNLLREGSVIDRMIKEIPEPDWQEQVQIIGWLYQYYNAEPKDKVFADLKKNIKISKENIPAATQLFTPDWIVRYMVENSLGRLWAEGHGKPEDTEWQYYLEEAEQEPEVQTKLAELRTQAAGLKPEDIRVIDPCQGSGHILAYMFDVLMQIYSSYGYSAREAVRMILEKNLWGLDIDDRASQLAYFSVMMKARHYDKRFLSRKMEDGSPDVPQPHVYAICESNRIDAHAVEFFTGGRPALQQAVNTLLAELRDAKLYGSILNVTPVDFEALYNRFNEIRDDAVYSMHHDAILNQLQPLVRIAQAMAQKYHVVCTNPPYMGSSGMNNELSKYVKKYYPDSKSDLFAVFMEKCMDFTTHGCFTAMITMQSWMFLSSFEKLRQKMLLQTIINMAHLGARAFDQIGGEVVQVTTFVNRKARINDYRATYKRLIEPKNENAKKDAFLTKSYDYIANADNFIKIPGSPIAYWLADCYYQIFNNKSISDYYIPKFGMSSGDGNKYIRFWYEVNIERVAFDCNDDKEFIKKMKKWNVLDKGGPFRRWYGNRINVILWENNGREIKNNPKSAVRSPHLFFKPHISWTLISSNSFSARYFENGYIIDTASNCLYFNNNHKYLLALLNTKCTTQILKILNPTMNFSCGVIGEIPFIYKKITLVDSIVNECVSLSKSDWDSYETSWDFKKHPFLYHFPFTPQQVQKEENNGYLIENTLEAAYRGWERECSERRQLLKQNEEELNRIFIDIYGLKDELTPEVADDDITVRKADLQRDVRSFISYAVGCMFGRYSLDKEGLVFAGGDFDKTYWRFRGQAALDDDGKPIYGGYAGISKASFHYPRLRDSEEWETATELSFAPDSDNIIPICDDEYFDDDIVGRFVEFVRCVFGFEKLEENLRFIADALGGKGTPRDVLRNYFLNDFYKDHCKTYQKRPIYWQFDSGKKNGFKCLIYMHRYQPDTLARIRTDYVHEQQSRYRTAIADVEAQMQGAATGARVKLSKRLTKLKEQAEELRVFEEKIYHLSDQMISIDLDDGVKHNYDLFKDVLAKIK